MSDSSYFLRYPVLGIALLAVPAAARSQPAVAPSATVRVIEVVDPWSGASGRQVVEDLTPPEIARIQRALAAAGFPCGRPTGRLDPATRLALGHFQSARGLGRCECVSYETVVALGIRPDVVAVIRAPLRDGTGSDVLVVLPGRRVGVGHQPVVGGRTGPSVFVGHDPAHGTGRAVAPPAVRDPRPPRPRPGPSVSGSGAPIRALTPPRPRPSAPFPRSATAAP